MEGEHPPWQRPASGSVQNCSHEGEGCAQPSVHPTMLFTRRVGFDKGILYNGRIHSPGMRYAPHNRLGSAWPPDRPSRSKNQSKGRSFPRAVRARWGGTRHDQLERHLCPSQSAWGHRDRIYTGLAPTGNPTIQGRATHRVTRRSALTPRFGGGQNSARSPGRPS